MFDEEYNNAEDVPSAVKHLYVESDGVFKLISMSQLRSQGDLPRVQEALRKEKENHAATKDNLRKFNGLDPEVVLSDLDRIAEYKAAAEGKLDDNAINAMVEQRIGSRLAPLERKLRTTEETVEQYNARIKAYETKDDNRLIRDQMRQAANAAKIDPLSIDDALDFGERVLQVVEENGVKRVITKDNSGVTGNIDATELLVEMQNKRPRWWPESRGSNASGGNGDAVGGDNPFSSETWNVTAQGALLKSDRRRAESMAKSAGTTIGGKRPAAKK